MFKKTAIMSAFCCIFPVIAIAGQCEVIDSDIFPNGHDGPERINLISVSENNQTRQVVTFRTGLRVNTDGAPNSYSSTDLTGTVSAINNICNGISVRDTATNNALSCSASRQIFARYRDSQWQEPSGFRVRWQNVIAPRTIDGRQVPCVFSEGPHKGFFGSLTTLKNGLTGAAAGECQVNDQVSSTTIPSLVLPSGDNALRRNGARIGDLVVTHNPANGITQTAIVADSGPPNNLGEGSVALNIALLKRAEMPKNYREIVRQLDTGQQQIIVTIIPGTSSFNRLRPYSAQNIDNRVKQWLTPLGMNSAAEFMQTISTCAPD
jgi:hypothetical protein